MGMERTDSRTDSYAHKQLTVTFPAVGHRCPMGGTKLYCLVTEARFGEQLAPGQTC